MGFSAAQLAEFEAHRQAVKEARNGSERWIEKSFIVNEKGSESAKDIYAHFKAWCEANQYYVDCPRVLGMKLRERGFVARKLGGQRFYLGGSLQK